MTDISKDFIYRSDLKQYLKDEFKNFSHDDFKSFLNFIGNNPDLQSANQAMLIFKQDPNANNVETQLNISFKYNREVTDINNTISVFDAKEKIIIPAYSLSNTHAIDSNQIEYEKTIVNITSRSEFNKLVDSFYPNKSLTVTEFFKIYVDDFVNPTAKESEFNIAVSQALLSNFIPSVSNNEMLNLIKDDYKLSKIKFNDIKNLQNTIKIAINNIRDIIYKIREDLNNEHQGNILNEGNGRASTINQREVSGNSKQEGSSVTKGRSGGDEIYSGYSTGRTVEQGSISQRAGSSTVHISSNANNRDELSSVHTISESSNTDELVHEGRSTGVQPNVENASGSDVSLQTNDNNRDDSERGASELHQNKREEYSESSYQDTIRSQREEQLLRTERSTSETVRDSESVHRNSEGISVADGGESSRSSDSGYRGENDSESDDVLSNSRQTDRNASESNRLYTRTTNSESEKSNGNSQETADSVQQDGGISDGLYNSFNDSTSISSNGRDQKLSISDSGAQNISEYSDVNSESTAIKSGTNNSEVDYSDVDSNTQTTDNSKSEFESTDNASTVTSHKSIFAKIATYSPILSSNTNGSNAYIENSDFTIDYQNESERFEKNLSALKLLKSLEKENRVEITEEEKQVLLGYTGFGGFDYNSFDDSCRFNDKFYSTRYAALLDIGITDKEYTELLKSTSTAFYTHTDIIDCIYEKLADFGFNGGKVLEPSCGVGKFIGRMPKEISANSQITGVELDPLTAKIASLLYPQSVIKNTGFEKTFAENYYDVAIGNVPFGSFSVFDSKNPELNNLSIHNYFFEKALKEVKPGGVVAFITSSMTMDSKSPYHREELAKKAHFLGAVRLPNNTFESSDANVMTDIIFLKKRDVPLQMIDNTDPQFDWVNAEGSDQAYVRKDESKSELKTIYLNNYFSKHPEQIAGKLEVASGAYGPRYVVRSENKEFSQESIDLIRAALKNVSNTNLQEVSELNFDQSVSDTNEVFLDPNFTNATEFSFYIDEKDVVRFKTTNFEKPLTYNEKYNKELSDKSTRIFKELLKIKDLYKTLRKLEIEETTSDSELSEIRKQLSEAYDNFRAKNIKQVMKAKRYYPKATDKPVLEYFIDSLKLTEDNSFNCLTFLEQTGKKGQYLGKSKIFTERVLFNHKEITSATTHQDALTLSINNKGKVDIPYMAKLLNQDPNELAESMLNKKILYIDPDQILFDENNKIVEFSGYVTEDEYLSGNIYKKIDAVNNFQSKYNVDFLSSQIEDLKKVIPQPLTPNDISSKIGARWIDAEYYTEFLNFFCNNGGINGKFVFNSNLDQFIYEGPKYDWGIDNKFTYAVTPSSGRGTLTAKDIFLKLLNGESLIVKKSIKVTEIDETGTSKETTKSVDDEEATAQVLSIAEKMQQHFDQWIFSDLNRRTKLVDKYNRLFNSIRPREYNGDLFTFDNINPDIKLRPHQKNAIARSILGGNSLFAHEVGAGKTFEMCVSAMEKIRLGKANRCVFVMPKPILAQFANDFYRLYPNCNILMPDNKDFSAENRRHFINRLTYGDHKIILLSKEQFAKIPMSLDYQDNYIKSKIDQEIELLKDPYIADDVKKKIKKNIDKLNTKLEKLYQKVKDKSDIKTGVTFEEIGCDALYVDEAHNYKNAYLECHTDGIPSGSKAGIALDMQMKCQYLNDKYNNEAIVFATGTPISNSVVDLYTMQTYLNQPALHDAGIYSLDAFIAQFGSISSEPELDATAQKFEFKSRLRSFRNVPDALKIFGECADIKTSEDLKDILTLPTPHFHIVTSPASKTQEEMINDISERAIRVKNGSVDRHIDNMLLISSDGRKIGLDPRLNDPLCPDNPNSKINKCAENIKKICDEDPIATQLVFCDLGTPPTDKKDYGKFNVYDDLKNKLVDMGLKPSEVRFIHEFNTDEEREKCFEDINAGEIKVLMGSTAKLGTGVNVQECLKAVHHLDINWKPSDLEQRNGRIIRQGNTYKDVDIYTYVSVGTFDSFMFQTVKRKADFIKNIMNNSTTKLARNVEIDKDEVKFSLEDCLAVSIKDPRIRDQLTLQREIGQLESEKKYFINNVSNVSIQVNNILPENIKNCNNQIKKLDRAISLLNNNANAQKILADQKSKESSQSDKTTAENEEKKFFAMDVREGINKHNKTFTDMQSAGKQILSIAAATSPQRKVYLGSYCGLELYIKKEQGINKNNQVCYINNVYFADPNYVDNILNESSPVELGDSPTGNITRITNAIKNFYVQSDKVKEELQKLEKELTEKTAYLEKNKNWDKEDILESKKKEYEVLTKQIAQGCDSSQKSNDIFLDEIRSESQDVVIEDAEIVKDIQEHKQENNQDNVLKDNHIEIVNVTPELIVDEYQQQIDASPDIESDNSVQYKSEEYSKEEVESDSVFISGDTNDELLIKSGGVYLPEYKVYKISKSSLVDYRFINYVAYNSLEDVDSNSRLPNKDVAKIILENHITDNSTTVSNDSTVSKKISI